MIPATLPATGMPVFAVNLPKPPNSVRLAENLAEAVGEESLPETFERLPRRLREDEANLRRVINLVSLVDEKGTKGSYAGWITRSALGQAASRADAAVLESLLMFFQKDGSIRDLESVAARILPPVPGSAKAPSFLERLIMKIDPLSGWRAYRRALLLASDDPLASLKLKELEDRGLRLTAGETGSVLGRSQRTAYLQDDDVDGLMRTLQRDAPGWLEERDAERRYRTAREAIASVLADPNVPYEHLWVPQIKIALKLLGDDLSSAVSSRINREYSLYPAVRGVFERRVRERHHQEGVGRFNDPETQRAIYFKANADRGAAMYVQSRPFDLPWNLGAPDVLFEVLATVIHEDDHHVRLRKRRYGGRREEKFAFELHGHGVEYLWRARHGDPGLLKGLTTENPLGFALAFRDYFEKFY